ncbi:hypothetical protein RirG_207010 [Rhizophagus irregularis DAOM 197198w]|uniref:CCHC-type domain-containing protein n=1 Tax=Rhizophagus irregularis (strain DAOM 197198w) TaxID=1432141 RepID=A0A015IT50_RHIIW|nr:hypothetical protein RirG_207010 [Rhizophagus irregularis DAOM 197198w]
MITKEFIKEYMKIIDLEDKEVRKEIHKWLNENTTWCEGCEIKWMNNMFRLGEIICKDCKEEDINEMDDRVKRLKKIFEGMGIIMIEGELLRLISMGYTDGEILDKEFIEIFQENKNESEKELRKKLDKLLKEQAGIMDSEESGEKSDNEESEEDNTDESEKIEEILSPEEDEEWNENIENINEEGIENIINTGGFGSSQNSDSNSSLNIKDSDNESELSDYNLQDLFQENILLNMATEIQIRRMLENALGLTANALDNALGAGQTIVDRIATAGNGRIVGMPTFSGKEDEDVNDWIRQFEVAFTVSGRPEGNIGGGACRQNKANIAITCLRKIALQWYNEEKERVVANLVNWCDHDDDRNLKNKLINRFTREDVKRRKMIELTRIKQGKMKVLKNIPEGLGLEPMLGYQVRRSSPTNLNDAVNMARREEEARSELLMKTMGLNIEQLGQEKNMEEILREETNKYKKMNPIAEELQNKEVKNDEMDEMIKKLERMEAHMMGRNGSTRRPMRRDNRNNVDWSKMSCYTCGKQGHTLKICRENQRGMNRRNNQVNYLNEDYDEEYDAYNIEYDGYDEYNEYENSEYDVYEMENESDVEENDMYPAPIRRSERNKDKVMNDERNRRRNVQWQEQ